MAEKQERQKCIYRIHRSTISQFIPDVCKPIYQVLAPDYTKIPCGMVMAGMAKDY